MTAEELRKKVEAGSQMIAFTYKGKDGDIDPWYDEKMKCVRHNLFYDGMQISTFDTEDAMNVTIFDRKSLNEIAEELTDIEYI